MSKWRDKKEKIMLCNAWQESRLTKAEFCRQNNIKAKTFYRWIDDLKNDNDNHDDNKAKDSTIKDSADSSSLKFVPINSSLVTLPKKVQ